MRQFLPSRKALTYHRTYQWTNTGNIFTSNTTSQNFTVLNVPADWGVLSTKIQLTTQFSGTSIAGLVLKLGTSTNANIFAGDFDLLQTALPTTISTSNFVQATRLNHDIIARFVSVGASINVIGAGRVDLVLVIGPV